MNDIAIFAVFLLVAVFIILLLSIALNPKTSAKVRFPFGAFFEFKGERPSNPPRAPQNQKTQANSLQQHAVGTKAWLAIKQHGQRDWTYPLSPNTQVYIGHRADNQIRLAHDPNADERHAVIHFENKRYYINNLSLQKGTRVNKRPVTKQVLGNGNTIVIGQTKIVFHEVKS